MHHARQFYLMVHHMSVPHGVKRLKRMPDLEVEANSQMCRDVVFSQKSRTRGAIQELSNPIVGTGSSDLSWMFVVPRADAKRELAKTWQVFLLSRQFVLRSLSECDQPLIVTLKCRIISLLRTGDIHFLTKFVFSFAFKRVLFVDISVANPRPTPVLSY